MLEKQIIEIFIKQHFTNFQSFIQKNLRIYSVYIPLQTEDGIKFPDLVLEDIADANISPMLKQMYVLEFKKNKIDYQSTCSQVLRYAKSLRQQLYRKKEVIPYIIAPDFSVWERKFCLDNNANCVQYNYELGVFN